MTWLFFSGTIIRVSTPLGSDRQSHISLSVARTSLGCHVMSLNMEAVAGMMNGTLIIWWSMNDRNILLSDCFVCAMDLSAIIVVFYVYRALSKLQK